MRRMRKRRLTFGLAMRAKLIAKGDSHWKCIVTDICSIRDVVVVGVAVHLLTY